MIRRKACWLAGLSLALAAFAAAAGWQPERLRDFAAETCRQWADTRALAPGFTRGPVATSAIIARGVEWGVLHRARSDAGAPLELEVIEPNGRTLRFVARSYRAPDTPEVLVALNVDCELQVARRINYSDDGVARTIDTLDADFRPRGPPDWLNPPLEWRPRAAATARSPLRVGLVDSGVNYRLTEINTRLARDGDGRLIGHDFWELDALPYDAHLLGGGFFVQRHGTRTASLLLAEAPEVELVPYRYPRPDMHRMRDLVAHAARHGVALVGLPLGGYRADEWDAFAEAARAHPDLLFIASAGNDGWDIDEQPVYPAALELDNLVVVTSADDFARPAERTNWGRASVDFLVPAENLRVLDYSGETTFASGSSYAVSRALALAARIKQANPDWQAADLVAELRRRYASPLAQGWASGGYIADPRAGAPIAKAKLPALEIDPAPLADGLRLSLDVVVLEPRWSRARVEATVRQAYDILAQCGIVAGEVGLTAIDGPDYLRDLTVGHAHTLFAALERRPPTVVFARDTHRPQPFTGEAFGRANTVRRPWLADSVWLMLDVDDPGVALAHELFHVLANSGEHVETPGNLMQGATRPDGIALAPRQCELARTVGREHGLLAAPG